jgi:hypothetical protein
MIKRTLALVGLGVLLGLAWLGNVLLDGAATAAPPPSPPAHVRWALGPASTRPPQTADAPALDAGESQATSRVTGRVRAGATPLSGARVHFDGQVVLSDAQGQFSLALATTRSGSLWPSDGTSLSQVVQLVGEWPPAGPLELVLSAPSGLVGRVLDSDLRAIAGARLAVVGYLDAQATTGADGSFELGPLPAGSMQVSVSAAGHVPLQAPAVIEPAVIGSRIFRLERAGSEPTTRHLELRAGDVQRVDLSLPTAPSAKAERP